MLFIILSPTYANNTCFIYLFIFLVSVPGSHIIPFPEGGHVGEVSVQVVVIIIWETAGVLLVFRFLCSAPLSEDRSSQS